MLKYQKIFIGFILLLVSTGIIDLYASISIWVYSGIFLILIGVLAYGSINIRSGLYCKVLNSGGTDEKIISVTFDDGPDKIGTPVILNILKKYNIKAAFFCIGQKAEANPDIIKLVNKEGHIIGGHSYSHHFMFDLFSSPKMLSELQRTESIINLILNKKIKMFRPPYGVTNPPLARAMQKMDYHIIGWSLRSKDTSIKDEYLLFNRLVKRLKAGDILLFHDTRSITANVLELFIKFALENNYRFERLDNILQIEAYE